MIVLISTSAIRVSSRKCLTVCSRAAISCSKQSAQLTQRADSLVRALRKIHLVLPRKKPVDKPIDLFAANLAEPRQIFVAGRSRIQPSKLEGIAALLVRAQAIPKSLQQRSKEGLRLLLAFELGQIIIPEALNLFHGRGIHGGRRDIAHEARPDLMIRERAGIALEESADRPIIDCLFSAPHRHCFRLTVSRSPQTKRH